jgi:hypothetical protein
MFSDIKIPENLVNHIVFSYINDEGMYEDHDTILIEDKDEYILTTKGKYFKYLIFGEILNAYSGKIYEKKKTESKTYSTPKCFKRI